MGSAEFEFGALPDSLGRIRKALKKFKLQLIEVKGKKIAFFSREMPEERIQEYLELVSKGGLKEYSEFEMLQLFVFQVFDYLVLSVNSLN